MRAARYLSVVVIGLLMYLSIFERTWGYTMAHKLAGGEEACVWSRLVVLPWSSSNLDALKREYATGLKVVEEDTSFGIQRIGTPRRTFWIKQDGRVLNGLATLAFVLAEQDWIARTSPNQGVRRGDVVMDVGAHVGTFGDDALRRGAAKVIMVEPDPVNVECIRRNFKKEIATEKVVIVPEGAWSSVGTLEFNVGIENSGTGSFARQADGASKLQVRVRPIDDMLRNLGIDKVDYLKFDIEGAEREALKGAADLLRRSKPRLMLDAYHKPDDLAVLPALIQGANRTYRQVCGVCTLQTGESGNQVIPYVVFFE